jgi:peptidyl-prolyl cis-trans isomerase A (cyclophilin A)
MRRNFIRRPLLMAALLTLSFIAALSQDASTPQAAPAKPATKPVTHAATHHPAAATVSAEPVAVFDTTVGKMHCTLFEKEAPITVKNFIDLATGAKDWTNPVSHVTKHKTPLYDGTIFHRVIPNFMIQGGDPAGNGSGDPGYTFKDEIVSTLMFDRPGRLAMANSGPNTNGSQFFITEVATPHLNGRYNLFGQCDDATVELVKQIARMATDPSNDRPFRPVKITHVSILRGAAAAAKPAAPAHRPAASTPTNPK